MIISDEVLRRRISETKFVAASTIERGKYSGQVTSCERTVTKINIEGKILGKRRRDRRYGMLVDLMMGEISVILKMQCRNEQHGVNSLPEHYVQTESESTMMLMIT